MAPHVGMFTRRGDSPAYAGVIHADGSVSEVKVCAGVDDALEVTLLPAAGHRMTVDNRSHQRADRLVLPDPDQLVLDDQGPA